MNEYISREDAIDKMRSLKSRFRAKNDWDSGYDTAIAEAFEHIKRVPVADVQPVSHGRWIDIYEWAKMHDSIPSGTCLYYWCSECQKEQEKKSNFCPHCGTRMDLGDEKT